MTAPVKSFAPATSDARSDFEADVIAGLSADPKSIPPKYFYDAEGSRLFEEITRLPEYYLTRTETGILEAHASELNAIIPQGTALVEFGSGACIKVQTLLDNVPGIAAYLPVDISGDFLKAQVERISAAYPRLAVHPGGRRFHQAVRAAAPSSRRCRRPDFSRARPSAASSRTMRWRSCAMPPRRSGRAACW